MYVKPFLAARPVFSLSAISYDSVSDHLVKNKILCVGETHLRNYANIFQIAAFLRPQKILSAQVLMHLI